MQIPDLEARIELLTDVIVALVRGASEQQRYMALATLRRHSCQGESGGVEASRLLEELRERRVA